MLKNKNAVVIGAGRGIGEAIAKLFARNSAYVTLMDYSEENLKKVASEITSLGGLTNYIVVDVSKIESVKKAFEKYRLLHKKIDVLVNNVGIYRENSDTHNDDGKINADIVDNLIKTNMLSYWWSVLMAKSLINDEGSVINISSVNGIIGKGNSDIYDLTKAGINNLTLNQARQFSPRKIRVNAICPNSTVTPMRDETIARYLKGKSREDFDKFEASTLPFKRLGSPSDIAELALFLASDKSKYMTGQIISIDGGFLLKPFFFS
jgi:NAD(P)-dependent dehydrogenase (short-subunit alcohol dehydrogenase family)